jgi:phosphatidylglycerophosphate synthase
MTNLQADDPSAVPTGFAARHRHATSRLGSAQKSTVGVAAYLRWVNRPLGGRLAAIGYGLEATPNHLTAISALWSFGAIAALALVRPEPWIAVAIAAALLIGYAFDSADGQLSRVRGGGSPAGEWLDHVVDIAKTTSLHAAVAISLYRFDADRAAGWLLVPLAFGIVQVTFFFAMMLRDQLGGKPPKSPAGQPASPVKALALLPMDFGLLGIVFVTRAQTSLFLACYGGLALFTFLFSCRSLPKAYRTIRDAATN